MLAQATKSSQSSPTAGADRWRRSWVRMCSVHVPGHGQLYDTVYEVSGMKVGFQATLELVHKGTVRLPGST